MQLSKYQHIYIIIYLLRNKTATNSMKNKILTLFHVVGKGTV